jgi:hypothetical protein
MMLLLLWLLLWLFVDDDDDDDDDDASFVAVSIFGPLGGPPGPGSAKLGFS